MGVQHLKIIPILIIVAMLAFSVRLVEFATGVSSLSGEAFAAKKEAPVEEMAAEPKEEMMAEKTDEAEIKMAEKSKGDSMEKMEEGDKKEEMKIEDDGPEIDWRDASDEELEYSEVRMEMFDDLTQRRKNIEKMEKDLITREALLKAAEQELDQKYNELSQLRAKIEDLLGKQSEEEKARIQSLVKVYEGMKPKDAARIFDTLDLDVLVAVMSRMGERKMSPILANMNPERARTVTILLAEEKQLPTLPN